jgi:hypothetical protein
MNEGDFIGLGYQYHRLVKNSIEEMIKSDNKNMTILKCEGKSVDEVWEVHEEITKWNDFNIAVPLLFNFYHGLELLLKGIVIRLNPEHLKKTHKISELYRIINEFYPKPEKFLTIVEKHLSERSSFQSVFSSNNSNIDNYYLIFRYPENINGEGYCHNFVRGKGNNGKERFSELMDDIDNLKCYLSEFIKSDRLT